MKASELMIGDWVLENGYKQIVEDLSMFDGINCFDENRFTPIVLTEDMLKANGFKRRPSANDKGWYIGNFWLTNDFELFVYKMHVKMSYVHELQHALRLCGFGELADNFKIE